jgi:hypothetical protein
MIDYIEFAKRLRGLARRADNFGKNRKDVLWEIIAIAEDYEQKANRIEMEMIIQAQRDAVEAS